MIFHGVYTTPQIIDSTVSTTSNNAVSGKAVSAYVLGEIGNTESKIVNELRDEESTDTMTSPKAVADYVTEQNFVKKSDIDSEIEILNENFNQAYESMSERVNGIEDRFGDLENKTVADYVESKVGSGGGGSGTLETITLPTDSIIVSGVDSTIQQVEMVSFGHVVSASFMITFNEDVRLTNMEDTRTFAILTENAPKAKNSAVGTLLGGMDTTAPVIHFMLYAPSTFYFTPQSTTINSFSNWRAFIIYISE
jgi:hypothetical protein